MAEVFGSGFGSAGVNAIQSGLSTGPAQTTEQVFGSPAQNFSNGFGSSGVEAIQAGLSTAPAQTTDQVFGTATNTAAASSLLYAAPATGAGGRPAKNIPAIVQPQKTDIRVRLKAMGSDDASKKRVYGDSADSQNILKILYETDGLLFPYTPTIQYSQDVDYQSISMVHTNMDLHAYSHTASVTLSVSGKFTIQNQREGIYALACVHFLRTISKMHFGDTDQLAGTPPPVLIFDGYGKYMFNKLPVILKSFSCNFEDNVDYVDVIGPKGIARLPSLFTISTSLIVQQTPDKMRTQFNLDKFRTGALMVGGGWI